MNLSNRRRTFLVGVERTGGNVEVAAKLLDAGEVRINCHGDQVETGFDSCDYCWLWLDRAGIVTHDTCKRFATGELQLKIKPQGRTPSV